MKDEELAKDAVQGYTGMLNKKFRYEELGTTCRIHMRNPFMSPIQSLYVPSHVTSSWLIKLETPVAVVSNVGCYDMLPAHRVWSSRTANLLHR
jgi:hypothetical protein